MELQQSCFALRTHLSSHRALLAPMQVQAAAAAKGAGGQAAHAAAGDADQLPPVSAGSFLSAAIDSGMVPVVDLREVFRQAQGSDIVKAAHAVHAGLMPPLTRIDPSQPSEVRRIVPSPRLGNGDAGAQLRAC